MCIPPRCYLGEPPEKISYKSYNLQDMKEKRKSTIFTLILVAVSLFFGILWEFYSDIGRIFVVKWEFTF